MFFTMVARSFARGWKPKLLAALTIALGAALAAAMLSLALDVGDKVARELRAYGANIEVKPKTAQVFRGQGGLEFDPLADTAFLSERDLLKIKMIFWRNNIVAFAPYLNSPGRAGSADLPVVGTWFNKKLVLETGETLRTGLRKTKPWVKVAGAWPKENAASGQAVIGRRAAKELGVKEGDSLVVNLGDKRADLLITGIFFNDEQLENKVLVGLDWLQAKMGLPDKINTAEVSALTTPENALARKYQKNADSLTPKEWERWYCTPYVDAIAFQVEEVMPGGTAKPVRQVAETEGAVLSKVQLLMTLLTAAALISTALAISSLMTAVVLDRAKEVGLSKALGAANWLVVALFLAEAALLGLIGGVAGYGAGILLAQSVARGVFGTALSLKVAVLPLTLSLSVLITLGGSLAAIRTIIGFSPKEVLHG